MATPLFTEDRSTASNGKNHKKNGAPAPAPDRGGAERAADQPAGAKERALESDHVGAAVKAQLKQLLLAVKAVRRGDFSVRYQVGEQEGIVADIGEILNEVIELNENLANEFVRLSKTVGQEGKMAERASIGHAKGGWATSVESVNTLIGELVQPTNEVARVITSVAHGDLSQKMTLEIDGRPLKGEFLRIGTTVNAMVDQLNSFASEVTRVAKEVGTEGKLGGQAVVKGASGIWRDLTDNVNQLAANLTNQVRNIAKVTTAVARGDLSQKITVDAKGEIFELKSTINIMVDQLSSFADEVTRVAKEVGTEGRLGGQADVKGVSGTWKALTDNVNSLARNLTDQVRNIAKVTTSVAHGDLSQKITVDARGEILELKSTINTMVDNLRSFAAEVTRVAKEVGTEGKLGGQADVKGVSGTWKDLTDNVNQLASNLTNQVRNIAKVTTAVAKGDLSQKITVDAKGEILELKSTINTMVDQLNSFAAEVTRVAKDVGTEGQLGGQANVKGVSGTWKDLTDNVNQLAANLTTQVRNIAKVTTAVAKGDLSQKITVEAKGEILELKSTINTMVDQLNSFAAEVTRVAKEVGTEGKLGGQADVKGVSGTWKDLTDNVNGLARNLTDQVRNIAKVTTAVAKGDLSQKITVDAKGEIYELKNTINTMVDQLNSFAAEVTRVAKEVGTEGRLGGQADVKGVSGTWKDLTDNVNGLARNLTDQVRNIAKVTTAVAQGDLSQKITVDAQGEILELKSTINTMVDQLSSFGAEVTRVAKEVGTEGRLGGQADVRGVLGIWKDLTDNVNGLARNLTDQVRNIAKVTTAVAKGDLSQKITVDAKGEIYELKNTINTMVDQLSSFAAEVSRVAKDVGTEGKLGGQADVIGVSGIWKDLTDNVNGLARNLTDQVRNIAKVTTAVARGDLSQTITVDAKGEILELKSTINTMVDQLSSFAAEVTRVAKEVGTEGKLGGQAEVKGVGGIWKDLTDNVNVMASNLTSQVREIIKVVTAVANGVLSQKVTLQAKGEVAALAETINSMTDTLRTFADQVTSVAREVGIEGKLGGQAKVPGAYGIWRDLTDNVNQLAGNLTTQVRAIAEVSTAVTKGDLTQHITVEAQGEVAALKDNINQMIANLKDTTEKNQEQDWLKTNLAKFSRMMQGQRSVTAVAQLIMSELSPLIDARQGTFFIAEKDERDGDFLNLIASYAFTERKSIASRYRLKEGLVGQCAFEKKRILLTNPPPDYVMIASSLGESAPRNVVVLPVLFEGELKAVIELAAFKPFTANYLNFLDQLMDSVGVILNMISSNTRTEDLLKQLQKSNVELETQAKELEDKAKLLEVKNQEIELASQSLEEKAEQLSLISKYKSEFLANMSHELRTPLNSLLILSKVLSENKDNNLTPEQVKFAGTVYSAGCDLLTLINDILDLSKVEAGKMPIAPQSVRLGELQETMERTFRPVAESKGIEFLIDMDARLPDAFYTDANRVQQILKNLLSNAFKFTEKGRVSLEVRSVRADQSRLQAKPGNVLAFIVRDSGIGIPKEKQKLIFEAFQQADGTTSRKYGGTGLGLTISREIAHLLGGTIEVESEIGKGSVFTLYLPETYAGSDDPGRRADDPHAEVPPLPADADFGGRRVILIDDDKRNIFALTSILEARGIEVLNAENGRAGVELVRDNPDVDLVLMDTMMPEMDGIEATQTIRQEERFKSLPIISLTAKAMKGDREKCLQAGASDYVTKPVDPERLLSLMHVWMARVRN
jgi:HAMP domain-containing protein/signal transduction histidine kinase/CheY-like chemotaxis protein